VAKGNIGEMMASADAAKFCMAATTREKRLTAYDCAADGSSWDSSES